MYFVKEAFPCRLFSLAVFAPNASAAMHRRELSYVGLSAPA
jgi:hypothetical protein